VRTLLERAVTDPRRGYGGRVHLDDEAVDHLVHVGDGDARAALSALEVAAGAAGVTTPGAEGPTANLGVDDVAQAMRRFRYDKAADGHYDQVSAFIKSMRGSDPDAAVYWLLRMLESGEDARFLARRMVIFASEDIGLADRGALGLAVDAFDALDKVGLPEARYALTHAAISLAVAPKSDGVKRALGAGLEAVARHGNAPVPPHLRDAHYRGARASGTVWDYDYPHDHSSGFAAGQTHLPEELVGRRLYEPTRHGHEAAVADRLADLAERQRRARARAGSDGHRRGRADVSGTEWAIIIAALFWGLLVLALCVLVARTVRILDEVVVTVRGVTERTLPILEGVDETVSGVNVELARVDTIVAGVQSITSTTDQLVGVVHATLSNPLIKAAGFAAGRHARRGRCASDGGHSVKRAFSIAVGLGAGLLIGAYVVRRMDEASQAVAPANLANQAGRAAGSFAERMRAAVEEGRIAAAEREAELRGRFDVPSVREAATGQ
jgi:hypothetical protein